MDFGELVKSSGWNLAQVVYEVEQYKILLPGIRDYIVHDVSDLLSKAVISSGHFTPIYSLDELGNWIHVSAVENIARMLDMEFDTDDFVALVKSKISDQLDIWNGNISAFNLLEHATETDPLRIARLAFLKNFFKFESMR